MNRKLILISASILSVAIIAASFLLRQTRLPTAQSNTKPEIVINYPATSPERVVENFYTAQLQGRQKGDQDPGSQYLDNQLKDQLSQASGSYDPVFCSPDTPIGVTYDRAVIKADHAQVATHLKYPSDSRELKINLKLAGNEWRITEIDCP